ncbi:MAG: Omp28-related outer membrane protein [Bacteroidota bacterium]
MNWNVVFTGLLLCLVFTASAQTIVSTEPQSRKAILEEYGGYTCGFCPSGHNISKYLEQIYGSELVVLNIQAGNFAVPGLGDLDLRSDFGEALNDQTGLIGYPAATVNRLVFPGQEQGYPNTTAINRSVWGEAIDAVLQMPSPVNVAMEASLDMETGILEVFVEVFYTASTAEANNYLHIGLLQNNIIAPQLVEETWEEEYTHQRVLRHFLTGQWGDTIATTSEGHFEARTYTYQLPGYFRDIVMNPSDLEIVAFISKGNQHIYTGTKTTPTYTLLSHDANALQIDLDDNAICGNWLAPTLTLRNDGLLPLQGATITYAVNGGTPQSMNWTGNLSTFDYQRIALPSIYYEPYADGIANTVQATLSFEASQPDANAGNDAVSTTFYHAPITSSALITVDLFTDNFGYELYWEITNEVGEIVASGGNLNVGANGGGKQLASENDPGAYGSNQFYRTEVLLPTEGCYQFTILDDFGDGVCCDYGGGFYKIEDEAGHLLLDGGAFEVVAVEGFELSSFITTSDHQEHSIGSVQFFPNPVGTSDILNIQLYPTESGLLTWRLLDARGQLVVQREVDVQAGVPFEATYTPQNLAGGLYLLQLEMGGRSLTERVVVK